MRITRRQIRNILKEATDMVNRDTGELITFGDDAKDAAPDAAVSDILSRLGITPKPEDRQPADASGASGVTLSDEEWQEVENEVVGKQDARQAKKYMKSYAASNAERARLNIDNLLTRLQDWSHMAFQDYASDNPNTDVQDVAYDLADAAEHEFETDEWEELMWHFDGNLNDLKIYAAESMG